MQLLGFKDYLEPSRRLSEALDLPLEVVDVHRFPDGESRVRIPTPKAAHLIFCRSLHHPNDKLVELMLAARTARESGVQRLTLVAPYYAYMRQDIAFHEGEAVSQKIVGEFVASLFDDLITVDPHLHRTPTLPQAVPARHAVALSGAHALRTFLAGRDSRPFLLGPDEESRQWVAAIAQPAGLKWGVAHKHRQGDRDIRISLPEVDFDGREVVIVDDVISTGRTVAVAAAQLKARGARRVHCLVTHPLFAPGAEAELAAAGVEHIWSSDSIPHPSNAFELAPLLAETIRELLRVPK